MPQVILDDMATSQVSIFAVQAQTNELKTRMQMCNVVNQKKLRHAHMVNIEKKIMLEGMRADFQQSRRAHSARDEYCQPGQTDSRHYAGRHRHYRRL